MVGDKNILVYDDFSFEKPCFMGNLYVQVIRGSETYSFEFSEEWLKKTDYSIIKLRKDIIQIPYKWRVFYSSLGIE